MVYTINNKNTKTWNDKTYVEAELVNPAGESFKVSAWAGEFNDKDTWDGELVKNEKGYWKLVTPKAVAGANFKTQQMEKAVARKEESIGKFQDNKDWSIMTSSTMRDAVLLALAEYQDPKVLDTLEQGIEKWRSYLIAHWEIDYKDTKPF
jgi:hypothetical protein